MNDILRPELIWIEGRCYRLNYSTTDVLTLQEHDLYGNDEPLNEFDDEDDGDDNSYDILQVNGGRFYTSLHVPKHYMGSVIGKKGATIARLQNDTRTDIKIPRQGDNKDITIFGSSVSNIKTAIRRINNIVMSSRMNQRPTHFISIPMNSPDIVKKLEEFKESVLQECHGIEECLFIRSTKVHITIGVMCLMDNEERILASKLLAEASDKHIIPLLRDYLPFKIRLKGLSYMNDEPKAMRVLFGCVEDDDPSAGVLQRLVDVVHAHFYKAGFIKREYDRDNVKMHVTLLNAKYKAMNENATDTKNSRKPHVTFDGSEIMAKFADYDFGAMELNCIHLSQRDTMGPDGYYQSTYVISCYEQ